jgi:hypothetical protein
MNIIAIIALAVAPTLWRFEVKTQIAGGFLAGHFYGGALAAILAVGFAVLDLAHISTAASFLNIAGAALLFFTAGFVYNFKHTVRVYEYRATARWGIVLALVCAAVGTFLLQSVAAFS